MSLPLLSGPLREADLSEFLTALNDEFVPAAERGITRAAEIEPDNEEYRRLVQQLQTGGDYYTNYTRTYRSGISPDRLCMTMCLANMCLGPMCGYRVFCC